MAGWNGEKRGLTHLDSEELCSKGQARVRFAEDGGRGAPCTQTAADVPLVCSPVLPVCDPR